MTLLWIIVATTVSGVISVLLAAVLSFGVLRRITPQLVSFGAGALLTAALCELLPEALSDIPAADMGLTLLCGLLGFFVLEKLLLWHHHHTQPDGPTLGASAAMVIVGDGLHNALDGVLIAAAFLHDPAVGIATATAVLLHEIPQEVGDFSILLASGMSRGKALLYNVASGATAVVGGCIAYVALTHVQAAIPYLLVVAAASFIYIAVADIIPHLQRDHRLRDLAVQLPLLLLGVGVIVL